MQAEAPAWSESGDWAPSTQARVVCTRVSAQTCSEKEHVVNDSLETVLNG